MARVPEAIGEVLIDGETSQLVEGPEEDECDDESSGNRTDPHLQVSQVVRVSDAWSSEESSGADFGGYKRTQYGEPGYLPPSCGVGFHGLAALSEANSNEENGGEVGEDYKKIERRHLSMHGIGGRMRSRRQIANGDSGIARVRMES